jgi:hypothetical protein
MADANAGESQYRTSCLQTVDHGSFIHSTFEASICDKTATSHLRYIHVRPCLLHVQSRRPIAHSWEFVTSLDYEVDFYTGKRPWKWTFWPYLLCRYSLLGAVICLLLVLSAPGRLNCLVRGPFNSHEGLTRMRCTLVQVWAKIQVLLTFLSVFMASMLIALRVYVPCTLAQGLTVLTPSPVLPSGIVISQYSSSHLSPCSLYSVF